MQVNTWVADIETENVFFRPTGIGRGLGLTCSCPSVRLSECPSVRVRSAGVRAARWRSEASLTSSTPAASPRRRLHRPVYPLGHRERQPIGSGRSVAGGGGGYRHPTATSAIPDTRDFHPYTGRVEPRQLRRGRHPRRRPGCHVQLATAVSEAGRCSTKQVPKRTGVTWPRFYHIEPHK